MEKNFSLPPSKLVKFAYLSLVAALLTLGLKFSAFFWTNSISLLSDALETVINLISSIILIVSLSISSRPPDEKHAYGYGKIEYISTAIEGFFILIASFSIILAAYKRITNKVILDHIFPGVYIAVGSALINLFIGLVLIKVSKKYDSILLEADGRHLLTDVWTTFGIVIGLLVMNFCPKRLWFLDPLFAILISLQIIKTAIILLKRAYSGLMDVSLPEDEVNLIVNIIKEIGGPRARFHCLKTRKVARDRFVEFHLVLPSYTTVKDSHDICCLIEERIQKSLPNTKVMIHIEPAEDESSWNGDKMGGINDESFSKR